MKKNIIISILTFISINQADFYKLNFDEDNLDSIKIGNQVWQQKNLEVSTYNDGTPIPQVSDKNKWCNLKTGAWMYYKNDSKFGKKYGKLYNWYAVAGIYNDESLKNIKLRKKLAPSGWKIPSKKDYELLINYLGGNKIAGGKMKEKGTLNWVTPNTGATNSSGFNALPGGGDGCQVLFANGYVSIFWTSTLDDNQNPLYLALEYKKSDAEFWDGRIKEGYYIRCLKE